MMIENAGDGFAGTGPLLDRSTPERLPVALVAGSTVLCEVALAFALVRGSAPPAVAIAVHVALSILVGALALAVLRRTRSALLVHLALWTFTAGPFGAALAAGLITLDLTARRRAVDQDFGRWLDDEVEAREHDPIGRLRSDLLDGRLRLVGDGAVRPLRATLEGDDRAAKFEALARIARRFDPSLSHVIHAALGDADPSVRVLASTVLAKLQTLHTREIATLQAAAAQAPASAEASLALARARLGYARSGLIKALQVRTELLAAGAAADDAVAAAPHSVPARALRDAIRAAIGAGGPAPGAAR
ncbi:MAG: hypothetical protein PGN34_26020 [Methylobacterium frigidaeris]